MHGDTALADHGVPRAGGQQTRRSRRRSSATRAQRIALAVVVGLGTALALTLEAAPTGSPLVDAIARAGVMTACILSAARARRRVLLLSAALVAIGSDGWMLLTSAAALLLSFGLAWTDRRDRVIGGVAGGLIGWAALQLSWPASPSGATAALAALALIPLWVSAYKVARTNTRRWVRRGLAGLALLLVLGTIAGAVLAMTQRSALLRAADDTVAAAEVLVSGTTDDSSDAFLANEREFGEVATATTSWWAGPARLVPVVAQNVRAIEVAASNGADLNAAAAQLASAVDYDSLSRQDGSIDLARLADFRGPASQAASAVATAEIELSEAASPWLLPPVAGQLEEFSEQVGEASAATEVGALATAQLPALLGAEGPRRYLLLLGSPSEARDIGGHLGNWAEIVVDDGKLDVVRVGEPYELFGPGTQPAPQLSPDTELPPSLVEVDPTRFPQNWGSSPDLDAVARLAADLFPQAAGGAPIDGVIYADPTAFAALLELTGPVESQGRVLDSATAVQFLTVDQYLLPDAETQSNSPFIQTALDRFTDSALPGPRRLADVVRDLRSTRATCSS